MLAQVTASRSSSCLQMFIVQVLNLKSDQFIRTQFLLTNQNSSQKIDRGQKDQDLARLLQVVFLLLLHQLDPKDSLKLLTIPVSNLKPVVLVHFLLQT